MHYDMCVERKEDKENMNKFLKGAMIVGLSAAMVGCSSNVASDDSDSKNESLSGTITAAGSSALKPPRCFNYSRCWWFRRRLKTGS